MTKAKGKRSPLYPKILFGFTDHPITVWAGVEFFELKNLPEPRALKIARETWQEGEGEMATAKRYEARENV
jgi:hypothetical protein